MNVIVAFLLKASKGQAANVQRQSLISYFYLTPTLSTSGEGRNHITTKNKVTCKRDYYFFSDHNYKPKTTKYKLLEWQ